MTPAVAVLKEHGVTISTLGDHFACFLTDKGSTEVATMLLAHPEGRAAFVRLVGQFLLRLPLAETSSLMLAQGIAAGMAAQGYPTYFGTARENVEIDQSIVRRRGRTESADPFLDEETSWALPVSNGAARFFSLQGFRLIPGTLLGKIATVPMVIVGAGAAGLLAARMLVDAGFRQVRVLEASGQYGGIWQYHQVRSGSRNNPFPFGYEEFRVEAAPGDGEQITQFLHQMAHPPRSSGRKPLLPAMKQAKVLHIGPGNLHHRVCYQDQEGEHVINAPIVLAALGQGKPLAPSRPGIMTTDVPPHEAGLRWQHVLSLAQAQQLHGKTVVLIGLGNSTAEMLVQLQRYRDAGIDVRYKVLTHYPRAAVRRPYDTQVQDGRLYRLYRDIHAPQLTHLAGDLSQIERAFERVRDSQNHEAEELLADVTHWTLRQAEGEERSLIVTLRSGERRAFPCNRLYTLIGYGHTKETLEEFGMGVLDEATGAIASDYDGEIQREPGQAGRVRLFPGYFGLGAVLKSAHNGNAQVIPGMLFRLPDLFFSICLRAAEYTFLYK